MGKPEVVGIRNPKVPPRAPAPAPAPKEKAPKPQVPEPLSADNQGNHAQVPAGFQVVAPITPNRIRKHEPAADVSAGPGSTWIVPGALYQDTYGGQGFAVMVGANVGRDGTVYGLLRSATDQVFHMTHGPLGQGNNMRGWILVNDNGVEYVCPTATTQAGWRVRQPTQAGAPAE